MDWIKIARWISLAAGILLIAYSSCHRNSSHFPVCGDLAVSSPVIVSFELSRSADDLKQIFGPRVHTVGEACGQPAINKLIRRLDSRNRADERIIIPLYVVFLFSFFMGMRGLNSTLSWIGAAAAVLAGGTDYIEDICLGHLSHEYLEPSQWLARLAWATDIKWIALGVTGLLGGLIFARRGGWRVLLAEFAAVIFAATVAAIAQPAFSPYLAVALTVSWPALLIMVACELIWPQPALIE
jgi:hypothetical protein